MADVKKFLDSAGTTHLWGKIKEQLDLKAAASDVTAINTKLGTIPDTVTQTTFADWIAAVALAAGDATAVEALAGRVTTIEGDYLKAADKTALAADITTNANAITVLNGDNTTTGSVAKSVKDAIDGEVTRANAAYAAKAYEGKVDTLIGSDSSKSARTIASEEVAKIVANADSSYDTLKEIADWILLHPTDAAEYNSRITALEGITDGIGGTGEKATVVAYVTDAIAALSSTYAGKAYEAKVDAAETDIDALQATHAKVGGTGEDKDNFKTVAQEVEAGIVALNLATTYYSKASGEANATAIAKLNGDASTAGSVAKAIADEKTRADAAYDAAGAAAAVLGTASDATTAATVYGVKAYADSLASNYATAAQGTKADSALQATDVVGLTNTEIDTAIANANKTS